MRSFRRRLRAQTANVPALVPADVATLYRLDRFHGQGLYGQGESIAFVEFTLPSARDDAAFWGKYSLRPDLNQPARATIMRGARSTPAGLGETDLDLQYAGALAPGAVLKAYVVDASAPMAEFPMQLWAALRAAAKDGMRIVSISLGGGDLALSEAGAIADPVGGRSWPDAAAFAADLDAWVKQAGLLCFVSAGDSGAYSAYPQDPRVQASWPATQGAFIAVGGTQLAVPGDVTSGEQAWGGQGDDPSGPGYNMANTLPQASGGGGPSAFVPTPGYQAALGASARRTPDISAFAGPLTVVDRGAEVPVWGTSASAPILAAVAALYHQATGRWMDHNVLYAAAADITAGNNYNSSLLRAELTTFATAGPGFDDCTGAGALDTAALPGM